MLHFKPLNIILFAALIPATACSVEQNEPSSANSVKSAKYTCPQVEGLFKIIATDKVYQQSPEAFIQSTSHLLKIDTDQTSELAPKLAIRQITFAQNSPWLENAEISYQVSSEGTELDFADFNISSNCFASAHASLQVATEFFGDSFSDYKFGPPENAVARTWQRPESNVNYVRYFSLTADEDSINFKVERDPAPDEESDDEEG